MTTEENITIEENTITTDANQENVTTETIEIVTEDKENTENVTIDEEKKLDNTEETNKITATEDKWSEEFNMDELFKDLFGEENPEEIKNETQEENKDIESQKTIDELNSFIKEKDNALEAKDLEISNAKSELEKLNEQLSEFDYYKEQFEKNDTAWKKLDENLTLKNLVSRHFAWEKIDLDSLVETVLWDELDAINNTIDNSSDAEKPAWKQSLQDMLNSTNVKIY